MNKFFKDVSDVQVMPDEIIKELFPKFLEAPEETRKAANRWILVKWGVTPEGLTYQVAYQDVVAIENRAYHLFVFKSDDVLIGHVPVRAASAIPPVADKTRGLDYFDWLEIQGTLIKFLNHNKFQPIDLNVSPENLVVYSVKETPEVVLEQIQKGESYTILVMPADKFLEQIKKLKEEEDNKPRIITPASYDITKT
jgi:hypothetical protein